MSSFQSIIEDIKKINEESTRIANEEGFEYAWACTGKILIDPIGEAVWYQMADEYNTTTWATLAYPQNAGFDQIVVVVDDEKDALSYTMDYDIKK